MGQGVWFPVCLILIICILEISKSAAINADMVYVTKDLLFHHETHIHVHEWNLDPAKPHFHIVKLDFIGVNNYNFTYFWGFKHRGTLHFTGLYCQNDFLIYNKWA